MLADFWSDMNMLFRGGDDPACPHSVRRGVYVRLPDAADPALQNEMMGEAEADSIEQHFARVASMAAATPTARPLWPIISAYHRWVTSAAAQKYNNTNAEHGCGVAVDPEYRGGGLGPELCRRLIRKARESIIARAHGGQAAVGSSGEISAGDVDTITGEQDAPLDAPDAPMYFVVELINDAGYATFDKLADEFDIETVFETQLGDTGEWLRVIEITV
jgi:GNAT superfamily N-acetyltransferase